jgi:hypothetical protein
MRAYASTEKDLERFLLYAVDRRRRPVKPDIANVMLAASAGTPGYAYARRIFQINCPLKMLVQLDRSMLRFRQRQLAELNSRASGDPFPRPRRLIIKSIAIEIARERFEITLGDVEQDDVLGVGCSDASAAVLFSQIGESSQVISRRSAARNRKTGVVETLGTVLICVATNQSCGGFTRQAP